MMGRIRYECPRAEAVRPRRRLAGPGAGAGDGPPRWGPARSRGAASVGMDGPAPETVPPTTPRGAGSPPAAPEGASLPPPPSLAPPRMMKLDPRSPDPPRLSPPRPRPRLPRGAGASVRANAAGRPPRPPGMGSLPAAGTCAAASSLPGAVTGAEGPRRAANRGSQQPPAHPLAPTTGYSARSRRCPSPRAPHWRPRGVGRLRPPPPGRVHLLGPSPKRCPPRGTPTSRTGCHGPTPAAWPPRPRPRRARPRVMRGTGSRPPGGAP